MGGGRRGDPVKKFKNSISIELLLFPLLFLCYHLSALDGKF